MEVLEVGKVIKPQIDIRSIPEIVSMLYGLEVVRFDELDSYDDRNYHIFVKSSNCNPHINSVSDDGYVLKILNTMDSKKIEWVEAQHLFMERLRNDGICTPVPIPNLSGQLMSLEKIYKDIDSLCVEYEEHIVRLFAYIPGKIIAAVPYTPRLLFQAGSLLGKIHTSTKEFHHPSFDTHSLLWKFEELPRLKRFLHAIHDDENRQMCKEVIEEFQTDVVPKFSQLRRGILHGDPSATNILVEKLPGSTEYHIRAILDFSHTMLSYYAFDVAVMIAYMTILATTMEINDIGGYILAGYKSVFGIRQEELQIMKTCVKVRVCQSLVLGAYTYSVQPWNTYALTTAANGWKLLKRMHKDDSGQLLDNWKNIMSNQYNEIM